MRGRRPGSGPGWPSAVASAGIHLSAFLVLWLVGRQQVQPMAFETFQVELVSPPAAERSDVEELAAPEEEPAVERPDETTPEPEPDPTPPPPDPDPAPPEPEEKPRPEPEKTPEPEPARPRPTPPPVDEEKRPSRSPDADPASEGGENMAVRMEGLRRDFPAYYGNIVRQMQRCFRWSGGGQWQAAVQFVINADGTVSGIRLVEPSGNTPFDVEAVSAVECAGRNDRLGPLPDALPYERLPVRFSFRPPGVGDGPPEAAPEVRDPR